MIALARAIECEACYYRATFGYRTTETREELGARMLMFFWRDVIRKEARR